MKETFCAAIQKSKILAEQSVEMADRNPRKRRPPSHFNDFEAVELINDSEADLADADLDESVMIRQVQMAQIPILMMILQIKFNNPSTSSK